MYRIEDIDKNFELSSIGERAVAFLNSKKAPFSITGLYEPTAESNPFTRTPYIDGVNGGVNWLSYHTSGGKVRFATDSPYVAIYAELDGTYHMPHMPLSGSCGFDIYKLTEDGERFLAALIPPIEIVTAQEHYTAVADLPHSDDKLNTYTLYFPLYNRIKRLDIGVSPDAHISEGQPFKLDEPIVYYGSSITQGGCASRPGNSYPALITHKTNVDHINLGFSGACVAEPEMADYISSLPMCALVYDYDYNAPNTEYLKETHEAFFKRIRKARPNLPVIILSAPFDCREGDDLARRDIIRSTFENAVLSGDENVYFIDGSRIFEGDFSDCCTVDGIHPNDLGFSRIAGKLIPVIKKALKI